MSTSVFTQTIARWFQRNFSSPEAVGLICFLFLTVLLLECFSTILVPVIISVIFAYLLAGVVGFFMRCRMPRSIAVLLTYSLFLGALVALIMAVIPTFINQLVHLARALPEAITRSQNSFSTWSQQYPSLFSPSVLNHALLLLKQHAAKIGQLVVTYSLLSVTGLMHTIIYFILVPLLVFFFLKDSTIITAWLSRFLPTHRRLIHTIWDDLQHKIGAYLRGRAIEMLIVSLVCLITFSALGLQYVFLLSILVGLSVMVPYIGTVIAAISLLVVGWMQWGVGVHLGYVLLAFVIIVALDANILFPLLFSETMGLHPVVIILSVLVFGGIWGFWGVFFAIPLASLLRAILVAWPQVP